MTQLVFRRGTDPWVREDGEIIEVPSRRSIAWTKMSDVQKHRSAIYLRVTEEVALQSRAAREF